VRCAARTSGIASHAVAGVCQYAAAVPKAHWSVARGRPHGAHAARVTRPAPEGRAAGRRALQLPRASLVLPATAFLTARNVAGGLIHRFR
jgi:hypothetical protein